MAFVDDLAEFVQGWCAASSAQRRREDRLRELRAEIAWTEREIQRVEAELARRPSRARHVAQLRHELRHREIEYAFIDGEAGGSA